MKLEPTDSNKASKVPPKYAFGRRHFGRLVAFALASGALAVDVLAASPHEPYALDLTLPLQEYDQPPLSSAAQAEVEVKLRRIYAKFGNRIREDQKSLMRRTVTYHVRMLESIRSIPQSNGDPPATVLKLLHSGARPKRSRARFQAASKLPKGRR